LVSVKEDGLGLRTGRGSVRPVLCFGRVCPARARGRRRAMGGSVYFLRLALKGPNADLEQAERIIEGLKEQERREIRELDGHWWEATYLDFEDEAAALRALELDLEGVNPDWHDYLLIG
jgi:hypothetical protein